MNIKQVEIGCRHSLLTCYLHSLSDELECMHERPAVLVLPGGGYYTLADREAEPIALAYLAQGFQAFVFRYAVGADVTFEDSYLDALAALNYLRENREMLHIRPGQIAVAGFSAGGHLAAALGTRPEQKADALILGYPVILSDFGRSIEKEIPSVDTLVTEKTAPTFLFSTQGDTAVPVKNSTIFLTALAENGVPFEAHIFRTGNHALALANFATANNKPEQMNDHVAQWFSMSIQFLSGVFRLRESTEKEKPERIEAKTPLDTPICEIAANEIKRKVLDQYFPGVMEPFLGNEMTRRFSLKRLAQVKPDLIPLEKLSIVEASLSYLDKMLSGSADTRPEDFAGDQKTGDAPVIACIGDSITFGAGVSGTRKSDSWTYLWNQMLAGRRQVLNFGFSGATLQREGDLPYCGQKLMQKMKESEPETVVVMFGTNDSKEQNWNAERFAREYRELVEEIREITSARRICLLVPPCAFAADGGDLAASGIRNQIIRDAIRPMILAYQGQKDIHVVDLYERTQGHPEWFTDGVHPNQEGNRLIAETMAALKIEEEE